MNTVTEPFARTKTDWQPVHEPVHFYSDGLRLSGQFTRGRGASPGERRPTIVCLHGYTGRKEVYMPGYIRELSGAGYHTLDFHHRGFGESEGVPRRNKPWDQVADVMSAMIYVRQRGDVDVDRIGLYGTSFGGSVAMMSAAHDEGIRCVVSVGSSAHCGRSSHDKRTYSQRLDWEDQMKIDRIERVDRPIGQDGQDDRGHGQQEQGRSQLLPAQARHSAMKVFPAGQQRRDRDPARRSDLKMTDRRQDAEDENQHGRHDAGDAEVVLSTAFTVAEYGEDGGQQE